MTHRRMPASVESVLLGALHHLTPAEVESATGKGIAAFYKMANPENRAQLSLKDAAALDRLLAAKGLGRPFGALFRALSESDDEALPAPEAALLAAMEQVGGIATAQKTGDPEAMAQAAEALLITARQLHAACARAAQRPQPRVVRMAAE